MSSRFHRFFAVLPAVSGASAGVAASVPIVRLPMLGIVACAGEASSLRRPDVIDTDPTAGAVVLSYAGSIDVQGGLGITPDGTRACAEVAVSDPASTIICVPLR